MKHLLILLFAAALLIAFAADTEAYASSPHPGYASPYYGATGWNTYRAPQWSSGPSPYTGGYASYHPAWGGYWGHPWIIDDDEYEEMLEEYEELREEHLDWAEEYTDWQRRYAPYRPHQPWYDEDFIRDWNWGFVRTRVCDRYGCHLVNLFR